MSEQSSPVSAVPLPVDTDRPLAEQIRRALSDEILGGALPPGTRLDEIALARRFDVSRTPVREALREMASAGLVEHQHRRGVFVIEIPDQRLAEMFEYAAEMEAVCARMAAVKMTRAEREELLAVHLDSHVHVVNEDVDAYDAANLRFHERLFSGCHNSYLFEAAMAARSRVLAYRRVQFTVGDRLSTSFAEHSGIVMAIVRGESEHAAEQIRDHVLSAHRTSQNYLGRRAPREEDDQSSQVS
ncbi:MAG: GntR family transcriptional regulator [Alcanivorax sp.]|uniref:GntR family transcriptional regulator n=1 Tax=Alloalcanivorax marinus TaxID=1177169 RepID=UPI00195E5E1A|nr:GntR family transcriptional regulator [Alloalcanivorax marinus]MBM7333173.1 GntR family transcriptional regulator [Alloalcanivorax marinus]